MTDATPSNVARRVSTRSPAHPQLAQRASFREAFAAYRGESLGTRMFLRGRYVLCPMRAVEQEVPARGRILDVGCGHGLFTSFMASGSSQRRIVGIDPAESKVQIARRSAGAFENVEYRCCFLEAVSDGPYDAVTILDVLYLMPDAAVRASLDHCRSLLSDDGLLLVKTNDTRPLWKYAVVRLEETLMVKIIRYTYGGEIFFRSREHYTRLLESAGFSVEMRMIDGFRPVPHRLFVCRKN